jgi:uncharacterized RDD family membrane protein YckC
MSCTNHPAVVDNLRPCERCSKPFCPNCVIVFGTAATGMIDPDSPAFGLINLLFYGLPIVYEGFFLAGSGQTPGKKWLGLKVVNPDGSDITTGQAWGRALGKTVINMCFGIGYLPALFTKEKTCVHDMLAKTRVIRL